MASLLLEAMCFLLVFVFLLLMMIQHGWKSWKRCSRSALTKVNLQKKEVSFLCSIVAWFQALSTTTTTTTTTTTIFVAVNCLGFLQYSTENDTAHLKKNQSFSFVLQLFWQINQKFICNCNISHGSMVSSPFPSICHKAKAWFLIVTMEEGRRRLNGKFAKFGKYPTCPLSQWLYAAHSLALYLAPLRN